MQLVRIVALRGGRFKPAEFRLRPGESGLSLFEIAEPRQVGAIIEAVQQAGKRGDLGGAVLPTSLLNALGLRVLSTPGGTPDPVVNTWHREARFSCWRRIRLRLSGINSADFFNEKFARKLFAAATLIDQEGAA